MTHPIALFTGTYPADHNGMLATYFDTLHKARVAHPTTATVRLELTNGQHRVSIQIKPESTLLKIEVGTPTKVQYLKSNEPKNVAAHVLAALIKGDFSPIQDAKNKTNTANIIFTTQIYVDQIISPTHLNQVDTDIDQFNPDQEKIPTFITNWQANPDFRSIHTQTNARVKLKDSMGSSIIHIAAKFNDIETIKNVLKASPHSLNDTTATNKTALFIAAKNNHIELATFLLSKKANTSLHQLNNNLTALHVAIRKGHLEMIRCLQKNGASVRWLQTVRQNELLTLALMEGRIDVAKSFLKNTHAINTISFHFNTWKSIAHLYPSSKISAWLTNKPTNAIHSLSFEEIASLMPGNEHMNAYLKIRKLNFENLANMPLRHQLFGKMLNSALPNEAYTQFVALDKEIQKLSRSIRKRPSILLPATLFTHAPQMEECISDMNNALIKHTVDTAYQRVLNGEPMGQITADLIQAVNAQKAMPSSMHQEDTSTKRQRLK